MVLSLSANIERWPVAGQFTIARGAKTHVDVVVVSVDDGSHVGLGEGTPIYYRGETAEEAVELLHEFAAEHDRFDRSGLLAELPAGAARNALDAALWDLECRRSGRALWELAGLPEPKPLTTAFTLSLDTPEVMEQAARDASHFALLKLKLGGDGGDFDRLAAVHHGAPNARLIVDANESWDEQDVAGHAAELLPYGVELIEQPVPAGKDEQLRGISSPIVLCADESCHIAADIDRLAGLYDAVNIKLDKSGGLTAAIELARAAQDANMRLMIGCMLSTSLAIRPAFPLGQLCEWVDLDGPALLARDREEAFGFDQGRISPP